MIRLLWHQISITFPWIEFLLDVICACFNVNTMATVCVYVLKIDDLGLCYGHIGYNRVVCYWYTFKTIYLFDQDLSHRNIWVHFNVLEFLLTLCFVAFGCLFFSSFLFGMEACLSQLDRQGTCIMRMGNLFR